MLKGAETSAVFDASTIVQPNKTENTCSDQGKVTKLNTEPGVRTSEEEEITKATASSENPLGSDTEKYEINTSSFKSGLKKKMDTASSDSCQTFVGVSLKEVNILDASPDCSPVCQPKAKKKLKRKNIESSSDEDSETDLPAFSLQVPNVLEQKQQEEEDKPLPKVKDGSKIEIKISPLDTDNIRCVLAAVTSSSTISKVSSADSTTDAQFTAKQSSSVMLPQAEQTVTNISAEPVPTFQRSPINSRDRSPRSEKSAKLAAAAEARMRKPNLEVVDTRLDSVRR